MPWHLPKENRPMIAACPKCDARYRVDEAKIGPDGARLRCAKCQAVFRLRAPEPVVPPSPQAQAEPVDPRASAPARRAPQPPQSAVSSVAQESAQPPPEPQYDRERLVLVADPSEEEGKQTAAALSAWGLQAILVHDGVEAMLSIQRALPRVVILDAALPKMYGFQVCEVMKRNESLRGIKVILVGAVHHRGRYRRPPSELYGADAYLEQPDLPEGLVSALVQCGLPISTAPTPAPTPAPAAVPSSVAAVAPPASESHPVTRPVPPPVAASATAPDPRVTEAPTLTDAPAPPVDDGLAEEREKAQRLARIVVSDIVLYQGERFDEVIREGRLLEALDTEIEEGRSFFRQRIDERVRDERDYLIEELMRVARERGMQ